MFEAEGSTSAKALRQELLSWSPGASRRETIVARRQEGGEGEELGEVARSQVFGGWRQGLRILTSILGGPSDGFEPREWGDLVYTSGGSLWLLCGGLSVGRGQRENKMRAQIGGVAAGGEQGDRGLESGWSWWRCERWLDLGNIWRMIWMKDVVCRGSSMYKNQRNLAFLLHSVCICPF